MHSDRRFRTPTVIAYSVNTRRERAVKQALGNKGRLNVTRFTERDVRNARPAQ